MYRLIGTNLEFTTGHVPDPNFLASGKTGKEEEFHGSCLGKEGVGREQSQQWFQED